MKSIRLTYLIIVFSFAIIPAIGQQDISDSGFTNKAEAKNLMVNGSWEGKWIYYRDSLNSTTADTSAPFYVLGIYKEGKPIGIKRGFYKNGKIEGKMPYRNGEENGKATVYYEDGKLMGEEPYTDGKINGIAKYYYENGKLKGEFPFANDTLIGLEKLYYENGIVREECPFTNNQANGLRKWYYESGKLKRETLYSNGVAGETKNYDETGKEIK